VVCGRGDCNIARYYIMVVTKKENGSREGNRTSCESYEDALKELEKLEKNKPVAKSYYSSMVDIFRLYVSRKKGINSLQKTTDDLVVQLKSINLSKDHFDPLAQSLRLSDFVKFAKYEPSREDDQQAMRSIRQAIMEIEKLN
jgi:chaperonin cofactor prefoldin